jgi:hypothetical protein
MALPSAPSGKAHVYRHLTDDGLVADDTNSNANVNGAVTAVPFYAGPPAGKVWDIHRMLVLIEDDAVITADNYGGISALANGCTLKIHRDGPSGPEVLDLMDNHAATNNASWGHFCYDITNHSFGSGSNFVVVRWTFAKAGEPLRLVGANDDKLVLLVQDDLSTLVEHTFIIQGLES